MREILFKAKRIDNSEWVEGLLTIMWGEYHIIHKNNENLAYPIIEETICQYTGLTDKNENKIWENDVVKYHFDEEVAPIRFGEYQNCFDSTKTSHIGFYVDWNNNKALRKDLGYWVNMIDCNVIGNIFDNPELIEAGGVNG